jgi:hypothetical protein
MGFRTLQIAANRWCFLPISADAFCQMSRVLSQNRHNQATDAGDVGHASERQENNPA